VIAQLGIPDMKTPIALALSWPERLSLDLPPLDLCRLGRLHFSEPDVVRFPCLELAYQALRTGGTAPAALNAANEVAVEAFLAERLGFAAIPRVIAAVLESHVAGPADSLAAVLAADAAGREAARNLIATACGGSR
jgi:1-deoxy-D-xylulose-5-phosphate reductoisomerase